MVGILFLFVNVIIWSVVFNATNFVIKISKLVVCRNILLTSDLHQLIFVRKQADDTFAFAMQHEHTFRLQLHYSQRKLIKETSITYKYIYISLIIVQSELCYY